MSGKNNNKTNHCKNQHIVPQFLQKGFSCDEKKLKTYRTNKEKTFPIGISNNFSQNQYYSEIPKIQDIELTLDQKITEKEQIIVNTLYELLNLKPNLEYSMNENYSVFIYHFLFRTKNFAENITDAIYNTILPKHTDEIYKIGMDIFLKKNTEDIKQIFLENNNLNFKQKLKIIQNPYLFNQSLKNFFQQNLIEIKNEMLDMFKKQKDSYNRTINSYSVQDNITIKYFKFQILEGHFVLPDNILIGYHENEDFEFLPFIGTNTKYLLFPLTKNKLLITYPDEFPSKEIFDVNKVNEYLVSFAKEFISDDNQSQFIEPLRKLLEKDKFMLIFLEDFEKEKENTINMLVKNLELELDKIRNNFRII